MKRIILYGIGGARYQYQVLKYFVVFDEKAGTSDIKRIAATMQVLNPSIEHVYMISERHGLKREFQESTKRHSIESCAIFKDTLEREGIRIF